VKTVLLIEDDSASAQELAEALANSEYSVHVAPTGAAAIEYVQSHRPDAILLDFGLPDIEGPLLAWRIRAILLERTPPIIVVSGMIDSPFLAKANPIGAAAYVKKPYSLKRIRALLEKLA
jgi:DNA-binding response OmpR family regulator